jgi:hypothetical protein
MPKIVDFDCMELIMKKNTGKNNSKGLATCRTMRFGMNSEIISSLNEANSDNNSPNFSTTLNSKNST